MARGTWDDFTAKYGFNDGATTDGLDWTARDKLVEILNERPEFKEQKLTAVAWDREGMHNSCFVLVFSNPDGMTAEQLVKAFEANEIKEAPLPEFSDVMIDELIDDAYNSVCDGPVKVEAGHGHTPDGPELWHVEIGQLSITLSGVQMRELVNGWQRVMGNEPLTTAPQRPSEG